MEIKVDNVNEALGEGLQWLLTAGIEEPSRNGPVIVSPEPVMTTYRYPQERVLFSPERDANPFFHLFESLWMLAGRHDIAFPARFNKNYAGYSDDGVTQHGAYGYRWRSHFGYDQLPIIIKELKANSATRRAVLQMWDATVERKDDLRYAMTPGTKDAPCNTHIYFDARGGYVNMTVLCRSNDIYWGAYGANAVHFSVLQEYVASMAGYPVGVYRQFSNNFHLYTELYPNLKGRSAIQQLASTAADFNYYEDLHWLPLVDNPEAWDEDLRKFLQWIEKNEVRTPNFENSFFRHTAAPMFVSWEDRKTKASDGLSAAKCILAKDWRRACIEWIERREQRKERAQHV